MFLVGPSSTLPERVFPVNVSQDLVDLVSLLLPCKALQDSARLPHLLMCHYAGYRPSQHNTDHIECIRILDKMQQYMKFGGFYWKSNWMEVWTQDEFVSKNSIDNERSPKRSRGMTHSSAVRRPLE